MTTPVDSPFIAYRIPVREEWIDYNGHMNDACYAILCTEATEEFLSALGLGACYQAATGCSAYTVELRLRYLKEVRRGQTLHAETLLAANDEKRIEISHSIRTDEGTEVATAELRYVHVDQRSGRVAPMPADRLELLGEVLAAHAEQLSARRARSADRP